jgi:hypothetical protein
MSYYDPNPDTVTILQCDRSQEEVGAWVRQIDANGNERDTEKRYSHIECECLAVTYGLEKFEFYLLGRTTIVETDHSPLEQIFKRWPSHRKECPPELLDYWNFRCDLVLEDGLILKGD